jgi:flagellar biosynthesis chaperone FliJ
MAFRFPLETLLRFQKSLERQQELLLQIANHEVANLIQRIEKTQSAMNWVRDEQQRALSSGERAVEMHFLVEFRKSLLAQQALLQTELEKREAERRKQMQLFQEIRRKRETTEALRDRQLHSFRERQSREVQRQTDDLFLLLSTRPRKSLPG